MSTFLKGLTKGKENIKSAFGKGDTTPVDSGKQLEIQREKVLGFHAYAQERVEQVKTTPGAERNPAVKKLIVDLDKLSADVKDKITKAKNVEEIETQRLRLAQIYTAANTATTAAKGPDLADFEKKRLKAKETLGEMRALKGAATYLPLQTTIQAADDTLVRATKMSEEAVNKTEVKAAKTELKRIDKLNDEAKLKSANFVKTAPKNLEEFEQKRTKANDRISGLRSLRGVMDDEYTAKRMVAVDRVLTDITTKARAAKTEQDVAVQIKRLDTIEPIAKEVEAGSKKAKVSDQGDIKALPKWKEELAAAQKARNGLVEVAIAQDEWKELGDLISEAQLAFGGEGATAALKKLEKYKEIVSRAEKKQERSRTTMPPVEVAKAVALVEPFLKKLDAIAPEYASKMRRDQSERLTYLGNDEPLNAVKELGTLLTTVQEDVQTIETQKTSAETKLKEFDTESNNLIKAGYKPEFFTVAGQLAKLARDVDLPGREYGRAVQHLDGALSTLTDVRDKQEANKKLWEAGTAKRAELRTFARTYLNWPPLIGKANKIIEALVSLEKFFGKTGDYTASLEYQAELELDFLEADLKEAIIDAKDMPPADDLVAYKKGLENANAEFNKASNLTSATLVQLKSELKGLAMPDATPLQVEYQELYEEWGDFMTDPTGQKPADIVKIYITAMEDIATRAKDLLNDKQKLTDYKKESETFDAKRPDGQLAKSLSAMVKQLAPKYGMKDQSAELDRLTLKTTPEDERSTGLLKMQKELDDLMAFEKRKEKERVELTKKVVTENVTSPLKRIKGKNEEFQDYQKVLEDEADDMMAMANSDDPYFLKMSRQETAKLAKKVLDVDPEPGSEDKLIKNPLRKVKKPYEAVEKEWSELREMLAGDMKEFMPTTHAALNKELVDLIGKSRSASPEDGLALFKDIRPRLVAAKQKVEVVRAEQKKYKARKERVEKQWAQVKKNAHMRVTDRATEFAAALEARLGEADSALKEENGTVRANSILKTLEDQLGKVETAKTVDESRAELQKLDAQVTQDQRTIRDMARAFESELKYFKETTIPHARELLKERAAAEKTLLEKAGDKLKGAGRAIANKVTRLKSDDGNMDVNLLDSLEATLKNASKPVQPYLDMLSTTKIGAAKMPQLSQAKSAFQNANGMLASATRTVESLKTVTGSNTVSITKDLKKVEANWTAQAANYAKALHAMAGAIRKSASDESDQEVKAAAEKAAKAVANAAGDFHGNAFSAEIAVLEKKDGSASDKKSAREKALVTMRGYRNYLKKHPVHRALAQSNNPFTEGSTIRASARGVLVALKRIELETLVGV